MRSYEAHVSALLAPEQGQSIPRRPTLRSSALFPLALEPGVNARLLFMGYWQVKRQIEQLTLILTLRNSHGDTLLRQQRTIADSKSYSIDCRELLTAIDHHSLHFNGSLEVEFFSLEDLVFPFPAVVINYYGEEFSSVVHTAQRVYNDYEDYSVNQGSQAHESGFNIYADEQREPFLALVNGPQAIEAPSMHLQFFNSRAEVLDHWLTIEKLRPYECKILYPARERDLASFLGETVGTCKAHFTTGWSFPRLLVGTRWKTPPRVSITHTYYDCSDKQLESDYWPPATEEWVDASLLLPLDYSTEKYTYAYLYPIYSPSEVTIDVLLYTLDGTLLAEIKDAALLRETQQHQQRLDLGNLAEKHTNRKEGTLGARLIARPIGSRPLPARIKIGVDLGTHEEGMPCNICTNLQPWNAQWTKKPSSFRWAPLLADQPGASLWITNSAPRKHYNQTAKGHLSFYREQDLTSLQRPINLAPHGTKILEIDQDEELKAFFDQQPGWCTIETDNPYVNSFYFSRNPSGWVGGDHGF